MYWKQKVLQRNNKTSSKTCQTEITVNTLRPANNQFGYYEHPE